jgi:hypothetical protein
VWDKTLSTLLTTLDRDLLMQGDFNVTETIQDIHAWNEAIRSKQAPNPAGLAKIGGESSKLRCGFVPLMNLQRDSIESPFTYMYVKNIFTIIFHKKWLPARMIPTFLHPTSRTIHPSIKQTATVGSL